MSIRTDVGTPSAATKSNASPIPDVIGLGGAIAGFAGGLVMAVVAALIALSLGSDIWLESRLIAAVFFGPEVVNQSGFVAGPVIVGTLVHLATAALLGSIYSIITRRILKLPSDFGTPLLTGLIYGMLVWMLAYFIILPAFNPALLQMYAPAFIVQHLVYGLVTGLVYTVLRPHPYAHAQEAEMAEMGEMENYLYQNGRG